MQRSKKNISPFEVLTFVLIAGALLLLTPTASTAQNDTSVKRTRIAVFSPLYLDSAFDASGNYRHGKTLPKHLLPGLDFYEGVQIAIDSLQKEKIAMDIFIYDTRSSRKKLGAVLQQEEIKTMDMFVGYVNMNEASQLARASAEMKIPFVNTNLPNDIGIKNNPHYIILNPTLGTHCNGIYKFLQKNYPLAPIYYFRKKGPTEDQLKNYFTEAEKNTSSVPLKIKYITLEDTITTDQLKKFLDSTKTTICIAGSLDINFGLTLTRQLASISKSYKTTVIGMPTWDNVDFNKSAYRGIDIIYSNSVYINSDSRLVQQINNHFKTKYFSRPGNMVFTGLETLHYFAHFLSATAPGTTSQIAVKKNTLFGEVDIQAVTNKQTGEPEYYENKKLYFIKKADGSIKGVY